MVGIYKITSPSNKVYIGQSVDIQRRFKEYKARYSKAKNKLNNSFSKHGVDNHKFEIIIECDVESLNELERYYQDFYDVLNTGLNCLLTKSSDRSGFISEEMKQKIGEKLKGRQYSQEYKENMSKILKGRVFTDEWRRKLSDNAKKRGVSPETQRKSVEARKGKPLSDETKKKLSEINKGRVISESHRKNIAKAKKKRVICVVTNKEWDSASDCALENGFSLSNMWNILNGHRKNNTSFRYATA